MSLGAGGNPMRSNVARRMSVRLSAGLAGLIPLDSSAAKRKQSSGDLGQAESLTCGTTGSSGGLNAQNLRPPSMSLGSEGAAEARTDIPAHNRNATNVRRHNLIGA